MAESNRQIMFIPLLEDVEGIDDAEEIIGLLKPGRDGVGVGGADIANGLLKDGEKVQWQHPYLKEANQKVRAICEEKGIPNMGMAFPTSGPGRCGSGQSQRGQDHHLLSRQSHLLRSVPQHHQEPQGLATMEIAPTPAAIRRSSA